MENKMELLAKDIYNWCIKKGIWEDNCIYFDGKAWATWDTWGEKHGKQLNEKLYEYENINPKEYSEYANPDTLSMTFEGALYDILNGFAPGWVRREKEFSQLFEKYGVYYELGYNWSLSAYTIDSVGIKRTVNSESNEPIFIYLNKDNVPDVLMNIMHKWYKMSEQVGDIGSCVMGAGFEFNWNGNRYKMSACSPWQGSISWETNREDIRKMLKDVGATDIVYNWGIMD